VVSNAQRKSTDRFGGWRDECVVGNMDGSDKIRWCSSVVVFSDAVESYKLPTTPSHRLHSPCIHLSFFNTNTIPLSSSPQPDTIPDLSSTLECIPSRNKSTMYVHVHLSFKGPSRSCSLRIAQIMSLRGRSIQTRRLHRPSLRACATPVSTPSLGPTTSSVEDPMHI
jgi:hypothetical protein